MHPVKQCNKTIRMAGTFFITSSKQIKMKFYLSLVVAAILMAGTANAQHVNIGIKGGLNVYTIHSDNNISYDAKTGFHLGLLAHIHLAPQLALQPEIVYSQEGAKFSIAGKEAKTKLDYINVPLLLQYMFDSGFRLEVGPQVGFLVGAKTENNNTTTDIKSYLKSVDFALGAGIGYVHAPSGFGVDARCNLGLGNINEPSPPKSTNNGFQLGVFYQFKHK